MEPVSATVEVDDEAAFDVSVEVAIIGAGAAGLVVALRARAAGATVLVLERDAVPAGSTALSAGLIPAAGTRIQLAAGIADSEAEFAADIAAKAKGTADPVRIATVVRAIPCAIDWLAEVHGLPFSVIDNFTYPGHSAYRMHGLPSRSGSELIDRLRGAAEAAGIDIVTGARVDTLLTDGARRISGLRLARPDGARERIGCAALVLACNGYGGNRALVRRHIPEFADALYFGHPGNQGDAILWGAALGARLADLSGHQGHGSVASPHGILITWATMTEGGFQINAEGRRFSNEALGYSEQAANVLAQPGGIAWSVFDARITAIARQFEDFRSAEAQGAVITAESLTELSARLGVPAAALEMAMAAVTAARATRQPDEFGRTWHGTRALAPPFHAVRVTGALFHTQGGLATDADARVLHENGAPFPNLFAAGGAARGVSGTTAAGYLSGNGLLTAVADGFIAGDAAARRVRQSL